MKILVTKRDGRIQEFDENKIQSAIDKCFEANSKKPLHLVPEVIKHIKNINKDVIHVEDIQDIIIVILQKVDFQIAKSYQDYRQERSIARKVQDSLNIDEYDQTILEIIDGVQNEATKENSNKNPKVLNTKRDLITGTKSRQMYRTYVMPKEVRKLHDKGVIHIHDTDYRILKEETNCGIFNLKDMLDNGTTLNGFMIETPKSLRTAANVATQIINAIGNLQYGGITMSLAHLAPYVRVSHIKHIKTVTEELKDLDLPEEEKTELINTISKKRLKKEIIDSVQIIQYQLNSMTSNSGQSPFITIWIDINEDKEYIRENAALIEALLDQRIQGMKSETGHIITPAFPKLIYVLDENNIKEDGEYFYLTKLAAKCSSCRITPDYVSAKVMRELKEGGLVPVMGCRSMVSPYYDSEGNYKTWGRFNIGVMSINLPYIALASESKEEFYSKLKEIFNILKKEQLKTAHTIAGSPSSAAPMLWNHGAYARLPKDAKIGDLVFNGYATASIGYAGVAEAVERFGIKYVSKEGQEFGLEIIKTLDNLCSEARKETKLGLSLYGTPLESTTQKFADALKDFPIIKNVNDKRFITNSYHVPVWEEVDAYTKLEFEAPFQKYSTGGCISYVEVPDVKKNEEAVLNIMKFIYDHIMYAEINTRNNDVCFLCDFEGEIKLDKNLKWVCPRCGNKDFSKMDIKKRTCGYIGSNEYNDGRSLDILNRVYHLGKEGFKKI